MLENSTNFTSMFDEALVELLNLYPRCFSPSTADLHAFKRKSSGTFMRSVKSLFQVRSPIQNIVDFITNFDSDEKTNHDCCSRSNRDRIISTLTPEDYDSLNEWFRKEKEDLIRIESEKLYKRAKPFTLELNNFRRFILGNIEDMLLKRSQYQMRLNSGDGAQFIGVHNRWTDNSKFQKPTKRTEFSQVVEWSNYSGLESPCTSVESKSSHEEVNNDKIVVNFNIKQNDTLKSDKRIMKKLKILRTNSSKLIQKKKINTVKFPKLQFRKYEPSESTDSTKTGSFESFITAKKWNNESILKNIFLSSSHSINGRHSVKTLFKTTSKRKLAKHKLTKINSDRDSKKIGSNKNSSMDNTAQQNQFLLNPSTSWKYILEPKPLEFASNQTPSLNSGNSGIDSESSRLLGENGTNTDLLSQSEIKKRDLNDSETSRLLGDNRTNTDSPLLGEIGKSNLKSMDLILELRADTKKSKSISYLTVEHNSNNCIDAFSAMSLPEGYKNIDLSTRAILAKFVFNWNSMENRNYSNEKYSNKINEQFQGNFIKRSCGIEDNLDKVGQVIQKNREHCEMKKIEQKKVKKDIPKQEEANRFTFSPKNIEIKKTDPKIKVDKSISTVDLFKDARISERFICNRHGVDKIIEKSLNEIQVNHISTDNSLYLQDRFQMDTSQKIIEANRSISNSRNKRISSFDGHTSNLKFSHSRSHRELSHDEKLLFGSYSHESRNGMSTQIPPNDSYKYCRKSNVLLELEQSVSHTREEKIHPSIHLKLNETSNHPFANLQTLIRLDPSVKRYAEEYTRLRKKITRNFRRLYAIVRITEFSEVFMYEVMKFTDLSPDSFIKSNQIKKSQINSVIQKQPNQRENITGTLFNPANGPVNKSKVTNKSQKSRVFVNSNSEKLSVEEIVYVNKKASIASKTAIFEQKRCFTNINSNSVRMGLARVSDFELFQLFEILRTKKETSLRYKGNNVEELFFLEKSRKEIQRYDEWFY